MEQHIPFTHEQLEALAREYPTPFYLYDEQGIRRAARRLNAAFAWCAGFREYFAVKATPNPHILSMLRRQGCGADCSSLAELLLAEKVGLSGEDIMFSSNDTPAVDFRKALALGAIVNLDDIGHIAFLERHAWLPKLVSLRYNPGRLRTGNPIIGHPEESKFGVTREQLFEGYRALRDGGVERFGLHTMLASNELDPAYVVETAKMLCELVVELWDTLALRVEFINLGGGIGIPYRPGEHAVDLDALSAGIRAVYNHTIVPRGLDPLGIFMECGRLITGPYGYLVARVLHIKHTYKTFVGLDASMANLMRPGMYGAYHHISVPGKDEQPALLLCDVTGSLCENNDKFAVDRLLPHVEAGDLVLIHDTGAHGHAMGFNYNGKLRSAEILLQSDGRARLIRRAETVDDYFATLDFSAL